MTALSMWYLPTLPYLMSSLKFKKFLTSTKLNFIENHYDFLEVWCSGWHVCLSLQRSRFESQPGQKI